MHFLLSVTEYHIFSSLEHPLFISQFLYIRILGPTEQGHCSGAHQDEVKVAARAVILI